MASNLRKSESDQIKDFISLCLKRWYYFVICMFVCGITGIVYYLNATPVFDVLAQVSLRNDEPLLGSSMSKPGSSVLSAFGISKGSDNVEDETLKISSQGYVKKAIKDLKLNTAYSQTKFFGFNNMALYDKSPLLLDIDNSVSDTIFTPLKFTFNIRSDETIVKLKKGFKTLVDQKITSFPAVIPTPFGDFTLSKSPYFNDYKYPMNIQALYASYDFWTQIYRKGLVIDFEKKTSDIIHLSMNTEYVPFAKKLLTGVIDAYNREWEGDKSIVADKTLGFINKELNSVESKLFEADRNIQIFKDKYNLTDIEADVVAYLTQSSELQAPLLEAQTRLSLTDVIIKFVNTPENKYVPIPFSISTSDPAFAEIINNYNLELINRNEMVGGSAQTLLSKSYDDQIEILHQTMLQSLNNVKQELQISLNTLEKKDQELISKLGKIPLIEKDFIQLKREQELQQEIYVYLLEMRVQAGVKGISLLPKLKMIDEPYVDNKRVSPNLKKIAFLILLFGGILFPLSLIYGVPSLTKRKNK